MMDGKPYPLPETWTESSIGNAVVKTKQRDPRKKPNEVFQYVDVSAVSNMSFKITGATPTLGSEAPSRARKAIETDDVLFATVRPTLKRIALVPPELDGAIASTRDDVFISIAGSIGITGMIPPELDGANLTENAARLIANDSSQIHPRFLLYWLASHHCQAEIKAQTVKNAQPKLALARIKSLKVPLPSHDEQVEIARALDLAGCKAENARAKRDQLQDLFRICGNL